jgi:hypothetical protein
LRKVPTGLSALALAVVAGVAGCGNSDAPPVVKVYPVKGKVLLANGKPLSGGHVYFVPAKDGLIVSSGAVGTDGTFTLTTGASGDGAPPGEFRVRVEPDLPARTAASSGRRVGTKALPFPSKYTDEDASGVLRTVEPRPNDLEPITLK